MTDQRARIPRYSINAVDYDQMTATVENLERQLEECRQILQERLDDIAALVTERKELREELAAAEARERACIRSLEELYAKAHQLGPESEMLGMADEALFNAMSARAKGKPDALTIALEQAREEGYKEGKDHAWPFEWVVATKLKRELAQCNTECKNWKRWLEERERQLAECQEQLAECRGGYEDCECELDHAGEDYNKLYLKLVAAEAREQKYGRFAEEARDIMRREGFVIDDLDDRWQKLCFTLYNLLIEIAGRVERSDHAALDAALEARSIHVIQFVTKAICHVSWSKEGWTDAMLDALGDFFEELHAALEQARAEERERLEDVLAASEGIEEFEAGEPLDWKEVRAEGGGRR
jgi:chromosome segregation ATPase